MPTTTSVPHKAVAVGYVSENELGDWARTVTQMEDLRQRQKKMQAAELLYSDKSQR